MKTANPYCEKLRRSFDDYLDGELSPLLKRVLAKHLKSCAACRREYTLLQMAVEAVRQKRAPDVPPRLLKKIIRNLSDSGSGGTPIPADLKGLDLLGGLQEG